MAHGPAAKPFREISIDFFATSVKRVRGCVDGDDRDFGEAGGRRAEGLQIGRCRRFHLEEVAQAAERPVGAHGIPDRADDLPRTETRSSGSWLPADFRRKLVRYPAHTGFAFQALKPPVSPARFTRQPHPWISSP